MKVNFVLSFLDKIPGA